MGNHNYNVAPGGSGACEPGCGHCTAANKASDGNGVSSLKDAISGIQVLMGRKRSAREPLERLLVALVDATKAGACLLALAEALAGGEEMAAGRLFDYRAGPDFPDVGTYDNVMDEVLRQLRPNVRRVAVREAFRHLTEDVVSSAGPVEWPATETAPTKSA